MNCFKLCTSVRNTFLIEPSVSQSTMKRQDTDGTLFTVQLTNLFVAVAATHRLSVAVGSLAEVRPVWITGQ